MPQQMQHAVDDQQRDLPLHGNAARGGLPRRVRIGESHLAKARRLAGNQREFGGHTAPARVPIQVSALFLNRREFGGHIAPAHVPVQTSALFLFERRGLRAGIGAGEERAALFD